MLFIGKINRFSNVFFTSSTYFTIYKDTNLSAILHTTKILANSIKMGVSKHYAFAIRVTTFYLTIILTNVIQKIEMLIREFLWQDAGKIFYSSYCLK